MSRRNRSASDRRAWQVQEAKARFSEMLDRALADGPQFVTKRGKETAVLLSAETWRELEARSRPSLKELLLSGDARTEELVPPRRKLRLRPPLSFD